MAKFKVGDFVFDRYGHHRYRVIELLDVDEDGDQPYTVQATDDPSIKFTSYLELNGMEKADWYRSMKPFQQHKDLGEFRFGDVVSVPWSTYQYSVIEVHPKDGYILYCPDHRGLAYGKGALKPKEANEEGWYKMGEVWK